MIHISLLNFKYLLSTATGSNQIYTFSENVQDEAPIKCQGVLALNSITNLSSTYLSKTLALANQQQI